MVTFWKVSAYNSNSNDGNSSVMNGLKQMPIQRVDYR
jgi:hypothetical protein